MGMSAFFGLHTVIGMRGWDRQGWEDEIQGSLDLGDTGTDWGKRDLIHL